MPAALQHALQIGVGQSKYSWASTLPPSAYVRAAEFSEPAISKGAVVQIDDNRHRLDACIEVVPGVSLPFSRVVQLPRNRTWPSRPLKCRADAAGAMTTIQAASRRRQGSLHRHGVHGPTTTSGRAAASSRAACSADSRVSPASRTSTSTSAPFEQAFGFVFVDGDQHPVAHRQCRRVSGAPCHIARNCRCAPVRVWSYSATPTRLLPQSGNHSTDSHPCDGFDPRLHAIPF